MNPAPTPLDTPTPVPPSASAPTVQTPPATARRRSRSLAHDVVEAITFQIQSQALQAGDRLPTESALMQQFGVSRTVVREAISRLQAADLVDTQHGVGTFVQAVRPDAGFRLTASDVATAIDVLAVLELRISLETEAAGLAAQRRTAVHLTELQRAIEAFAAAIESPGDTVNPDIEFHLCIAQATGNRYFVDVMRHLGATLLPRARLNAARLSAPEQIAYLRRVNQEHQQIYDAIERADTEGARAAMRLHLGNGRERQRRALERVQGVVDGASTVLAQQ
jgi:GntR family transcriptional regulator, transcriptional repressor for pyruvate dehydrogenase complex